MIWSRLMMLNLRQKHILHRQ